MAGEDALPATPASSTAAQTAQDEEERLALRDGTVITIRAARPTDKELLARGFEQLSGESRRRRFLTPMGALDRAELDYLTEVDHFDHEALGALGPNGEPVGIARYVRRADDPEAADVAVAVVDAWQQRGVATALLTRLAQRAQACGIRRLSATILPENRDVLELLSAAGAAEGPESGSGLVEFEIDLDRVAEEDRGVRDILRHAALRLFSLAQRADPPPRPDRDGNPLSPRGQRRES
jgi:GNAT superfamily N-acetyltransferase